MRGLDLLAQLLDPPPGMPAAALSYHQL